MILAVDDEPGVLALVRRCVDDERVTLIEASSGKNALEQIAKGPALDLLITDLRMRKWKATSSLGGSARWSPT